MTCQRGNRLCQTLPAMGLQRVPVEAHARRHGCGQARQRRIGEPKQGVQRLHEVIILRRMAERVQPIANLRRTEFTQIAVDVFD